MTKRNIYINAPLTRRVLSYFIDWYLGALCAAFPLAVVSQKLYGTMLKQNLLKNSTTLWIYCGDYRSNFCFVLLHLYSFLCL